MTAAVMCIASLARIRWALLRTCWSAQIRRTWLAAVPFTMEAARTLAEAAQVPLTALYLPDPSRRAMLRAWIYGRTRGRDRDTMWSDVVENLFIILDEVRRERDALVLALATERARARK